MGGDHAPAVEVEGAVLALRELPSTFRIQLVGRIADIETGVKRQADVDSERVDIVDAPEVGGMGEKPLAAMKSKPGSSIGVGLGLQNKHASDAFISAGNTGAVMAAATLLLRLHHGVRRAAIGAPFPTAAHPVVVIDGGANVDCDARELVNFAHLGSVYARDVLGRSEPGVGLLNVGEEDEKGNAVVKETHQLLKAARNVRYLGNVEGRDILAGACKAGRIDVVVCDGFVGNAILKFYESAGRMFAQLLQDALPDAVSRPEVKRLFKFLDYSEYGGAPLLGVRGVAIICHGASPARAITSAVRAGLQMVESSLTQAMDSAFTAGAVGRGRRGERGAVGERSERGGRGGRGGAGAGSAPSSSSLAPAATPRHALSPPRSSPKSS